MPEFANRIARSLSDKLGEQPSALDFIPEAQHAAVRAGTASADLTSAIQNGLNAVASAGGGVLYLPWGVYPLMDLTVPPNVFLQGDGAARTILKRTGNLPAGRGVLNFAGAKSGCGELAIDGQVTTPATALYSSLSDPSASPLIANSSIRVHPGASDITLFRCRIFHTGGYAVHIDARTANVYRVEIIEPHLHDNRSFLFGATAGNEIYGSWTGGILAQGDGLTNNSGVRGLTVRDGRLRRGTGNQVWSHLYGFGTLHTDFRIQGCTFEDIGRDGIMLGGVVGGDIAGNFFRRIGYICTDDGSAGVPRWINGQWAVGLDTAGLTRGVSYRGNSFVSCYGAAMDLDGFAEGVVSDNTVIVPAVGEPEYTEDAIASWAGNYCYGVQTSNTNNLSDAAIGVRVTGNRFRNCGLGAVRMYASRRGAVSGNTIEHPAGATVAPIVLGNIGSGANQRAYANTVTDNDIHYSPAAITASVQEDPNGFAFSGSDINRVYGNRLHGTNTFEFLRAATSGSRTAREFASNKSGLAAESKTTLQREDGYLRAYWTNGSVTKSVLSLLDQAALSGGGSGGPLLNISLDAVGGVIATGARTSSAFDDAVLSSKFYADGFLALAATTFAAAEANLLADTVGLIRYNATTKTFEQSTLASAGARVWTPFEPSRWSVLGADIYRSSGRVTIGSSLPGSLLTLRANTDDGLTVTNNTQTGVYFVSSYGGPAFGSTSAHPLVFLTNNAARGRITDAGNWLIGANTDDASGARLQIAGFARATIGFATPSTNTDAIQATVGGVTARFLIGTRSLTLVGDTAANAGVSGLGQGRIYFDSSTNRFRISENGGAFQDLTGAGVTSLTGTANQVNVSSATGAVTLSLPQNIHSGAQPTFDGLSISTYLYTKGGAGGNGSQTHLPLAGGDGRNYIRGGTVLADGGGNVLVATNVDDGSGARLQVNSFVRAITGFATPSANTDAIQVPSGGVTARFLIGTRSLTLTAESAANAGLSAIGQGRLYFDSSTNRFRVSENGGPFQDLTGIGVTSLAGTANQVNVSAATGAVTLSLPQNVHTGAAPTFDGLTLASYLYTRGGTAGNGAQTHLPWPGDSRNYIRGTTVIGDTGGNVLVATSADDGSGARLQINGFARAITGFATPSSATDALQAPSGGVTARFLIGTRSLTLTADTAANAGLAAVGQGRIYYDSGTNKFRVSENGGAYVDLASGNYWRQSAWSQANVDEWPTYVFVREGSANWDEGIIKGGSNRSRLGAINAIWGPHLGANNSFGVFSTGWDNLFEVRGGSGNVAIKGSVSIGGSSNPAVLGVLGGSTQATSLATSRSLAVTSIQTLNTSGWLLTTFMSGNSPSMQVVDQAASAAGNFNLMPYGGNVGIGTGSSSPGLKLDVRGVGTAGNTLWLQTLFNTESSYSINSGTGILFQYGGGHVQGGISGNIEQHINGGRGYLSFRTTTDGGATLPERMRITADGNTGIGTSSAANNRLHIVGGSLCVNPTNQGEHHAVGGIGIVHGGSGVPNRALQIFPASDNNPSYAIQAGRASGNWYWWTYGVNTDNSFRLARGADSITGNDFVITAGGNVGIGTASPTASSTSTARLEVVGSTRTTLLHGQNALFILPAANNGAANGDAGLYLWISEPWVSWTGAAIARNITNAPNLPRVNLSLSGQMMRFDEGTGILFTSESVAGNRYYPLTLVEDRVLVATQSDNGSGAKLQIAGGVTAAPFNATATGAAIAFQTSNGSFQVDGNGNISGSGSANLSQGYRIGGTFVIDSSRNATNLASATAAGVFQSQASGGSIAFQTANFAFQVDGNGNISGSGSANLSQGYRVGGTFVIDSSRNATNLASATAAGVFQSQASGGNIAFQTTNFAFQVDGNGNISGSGSANLSQGYRVGGTFVIDSSRNATNLASATAAGVFQSQASGGSIAFQTTNFNFQVNGNGVVSTAGGINVSGVTCINTSRQFVGYGVDVSYFGISAGGYNVYGGYVGQTWNVSGSFTINGASYSTLVFRGGILVSAW
jgi:hypothetical protein